MLAAEPTLGALERDKIVDADADAISRGWERGWQGRGVADAVSRIRGVAGKEEAAEVCAGT
jgi:hypothetical protein